VRRGDDRAAGSLPRIGWGVVLMAVLAGVWWCDGLRVVWQGVATAVEPTPTCLTETHILDGVRCVAERQTLYPAIDRLPLAYHLYQPLTYVPAGLMGRAAKLDLDGMLVAGRCVSLVSMLGILALVGVYVWRVSGNAWCAALAPAMVLYFHSSTLTDFFRNRPETPAILLSLAGWMIAQSRARGWVWLAALAFVGAMSFKPTFVAAPAAVCVQLVIERRFREMAALVSVSAALGAAVVVGGFVFLGEGYFEHTVLAMMSNPFEPIERSVMFYGALARWHWGMLLPASVVCVAWLAYRKACLPLLVYFVVCLAVTTVAHGKLGSDLNYHGELSVLMVLATASGIGLMLRFGSRVAAVPLLLLVIGTGSSFVGHGLGWNGLSLNRMVPRPYWTAERELPGADEYVARYGEYRGRALILDDEIAVRVGEPVVYDWYALSLLFSTGHASFELLEEMVRDRRYEVIVLTPSHTNEWAQRLRATMAAGGYRLVRRDERVEEYVAN
jgi:hypothetical protein